MGQSKQTNNADNAKRDKLNSDGSTADGRLPVVFFLLGLGIILGLGLVFGLIPIG